MQMLESYLLKVLKLRCRNTNQDNKFFVGLRVNYTQFKSTVDMLRNATIYF
jgi:hypothetical protein